MARQIPNSVIGLIEELEASTPPKCIESNQSLADANRYAGKVELIAHLRARYEAGMRKDRKGLPKVLT